MPYIKKNDRKKFDSLVSSLSEEVHKHGEAKGFQVMAGDLNYIITTLIYKTYRQDKNFKIGYSEYNEMIGLLECAKLELYRRQLSEYEDKKIKENGDVID